MKTYDEILERLFTHLRPLAPQETEVAEDTDLIGTLGLDSTTVINIVLEIEDEFDISVPLNALVDIRTPGQLASLVHRIVEVD